MAAARDSIELKLKLAREKQFQRGVNKSARAIDNLGDQASQAARKMMEFNAASSKTRVSLGPFSTSMRGAAFAVGGLIMFTKSAIPVALSLTEALVQAGATAGGAGLVGLTAFGQAALVGKLAMSDFTQAVNGNKQALQRLHPAALNLVATTKKVKDQLGERAAINLFPGLDKGANSAMKNLPVLNRIVGDTAKTLGGLGADAGAKFGSKAFGKDLGEIGKRNTIIIDNLGRSVLNLADGFVAVVHEAGPVAQWLSEAALRGSHLTEVWLKNARASGKMAEFFKTGKRDLQLLASITGHLSGGVLNLFGHQDVDGTQTLANLDKLTAKFDTWTRSIAGKPLGPELEKQMSLALSGLASFIGSHLGRAGTTAAKAFWDAWWHADVWGKGITALYLLNKFGFTKSVLKGMSAALFGGVVRKGKGVGGGGATGTMTVEAAVVNVYGGKGPGGLPVPDKKPGGGKGRAARNILGFGARAAPEVAAAYALAGGRAPDWVPVIGGQRLYKDPKDPRGMTGAELTKKINARRENIDRERRTGVATPAVMAKQVAGLHKLEALRNQRMVEANTAAYKGYTGIPQITIDNTINLADGPIYKANQRAEKRHNSKRKVRK